MPGFHVNGALTLGENVADNSGLAIAYRAYKLSLAGKPAPVIDGLTGEQRFYYGWAQVWRGKSRDAGDDSPDQGRSAFAAGGTRHGAAAQPARVLRSLRRQGRRQDVPAARSAHHPVVIPGAGSDDATGMR